MLKSKRRVEFYFTKPLTLEYFKADLQLICYLRANFVSKDVKLLKRECYNLIERLFENRHMSMEHLSVVVQSFYLDISELALKASPTPSEFSTSEFLEHVEDFICVQAHGVLFCARSDEETLDISLQDRIRALHWVTQGFLETPLDFGSETVEELVVDAMIKISEMNSCKQIREKFNCLATCAMKIIEAIRASTNNPASADEFFPALIYIILKSNPTLMHSNLSFIRRFSVDFRIFSGETGYYYTNLCSAVHFIQQMNADSLQVPSDIFNALSNPKMLTE